MIIFIKVNRLLKTIKESTDFDKIIYSVGNTIKDLRIKALNNAAKKHQESGLIGVNSEFYEGGHWLGSFATYLVTKRGITDE